MSYINDALKKAQRERDERYVRFGGMIDPPPPGRQPARRRRVAFAAVVLVGFLLAAGLAAVVARPSLPPLLSRQDAGMPGPVPTQGTSTPRVAVSPAPADPPPIAASVAAPVAPPATVAGETRGRPLAKEREPLAAVPTNAPVRAASSAKAKEEAAARLAETRYREGLGAQRRGDLKVAEGLYQEALQLDPAHVRALNNAGVLYLGQKRFDRAAEMFRRAIALKKDYVDPYYNLACLYAQDGKIEESLRQLKAALALDRDVKNWAEKDADMKNVVASEAYKTLVGGLKN